MIATPNGLVAVCRLLVAAIFAVLTGSLLKGPGALLSMSALGLGGLCWIATSLIMLALPGISRERLSGYLIAVVAAVFTVQIPVFGAGPAALAALAMVTGIWLGQIPAPIQRMRVYARRYGRVEFAVIAIEEARRHRDAAGRRGSINAASIPQAHFKMAA